MGSRELSAALPRHRKWTGRWESNPKTPPTYCVTRRAEGHLSSWVQNVFHIAQYQRKHPDGWLPPDLMALLGPRSRLFGARMKVARFTQSLTAFGAFDEP
jgi:hypothetical protein